MRDTMELFFRQATALKGNGKMASAREAVNEIRESINLLNADAWIAPLPSPYREQVDAIKQHIAKILTTLADTLDALPESQRITGVGGGARDEATKGLVRAVNELNMLLGETPPKDITSKPLRASQRIMVSPSAIRAAMRAEAVKQERAAARPAARSIRTGISISTPVPRSRLAPTERERFERMKEGVVFCKTLCKKGASKDINAFAERVRKDAFDVPMPLPYAKVTKELGDRVLYRLQLLAFDLDHPQELEEEYRGSGEAAPTRAELRQGAIDYLDNNVLSIIERILAQP